jgi:dTDP-4-dehydrorhamnose reductase
VRRILLIGKDGQVGWELQRTLPTLGELIAIDREGMDLTKPDAIRAVIRDVRPNLIVNAAAYTAVDKAEADGDSAMAINGLALGIIAEEAKKLNAMIIHYSTDHVFDGMKAAPYTEEDQPGPLNVYGRTKLAGEQAIQAIGVPHLILRTSWVYGARGKNFLRTVLRLAREREELHMVDDHIGAPTWCRTIAEATTQALAQLYSPFAPRAVSIADLSGVYHFTASGETSWFGFAQAIVRQMRLNRMEVASRVLPIPAAQYPLPAARPQNSVLSTKKFSQTFGLLAPNWKDALGLCLQHMA